MFDAPRKQTASKLSYHRLDETAVGYLRGLPSLIGADLGTITERLCTHLQTQPDLAAALSEPGKVERLKLAQLARWGELMKGDFDGPSLASNAALLGDQHVKALLEPGCYVGAYLYVFEGIIEAILRKARKPEDALPHLRAALRAMAVDMDFALTAHAKTREAKKPKPPAVSATNPIDQEIEDKVSRVASMGGNLTQLTRDLDGASETLHSALSGLGAAYKETSTHIETIAAATEELQTSSTAIAEQISSTADLAAASAKDVAKSLGLTQRLEEAAGSIEESVKLVRNIAENTKRLVSNAIVEATRAGDAGKGFAVVAGEVEYLARQTEIAILEVDFLSSTIRDATTSVADAIQSVEQSVTEISTAAQDIGAASQSHRKTMADVAGHSRSAAVRSREAGQQLNAFTSRIADVERMSERVNEWSDRMNRDVADISRRLSTAVRSSGAANRRAHPRVPVICKAELTVEGRKYPGILADLSQCGSLIRVDLPDGVAETQGLLTTTYLSGLPVFVISSSGLGTHLKFEELEDIQNQAIGTLIHRTQVQDKWYIDLVTQTAKRIGKTFEGELEAQRVTEEDLFDTDYKEIAGSNPTQYTTRFTEMTDRVLPAIQEPIITNDPQIRFCAAVDKNAYLPTHNLNVSKTQRPNDPEWNLVHCRNRRIFDDRIGLRAARNTDPHLILSHGNDARCDKHGCLKEFTAPIMVKGQHWGGFRLATVAHLD